MANEVALFGGNQNSQMPAHLQDKFKDRNNVGEGVSVPSLSYEGKVWTISLAGRPKQLTKIDEDGEETPIPMIKVVIADCNQRRGRAYYEGSYDPDKPGTPTCWSADGEAPDSDVPTEVIEKKTSSKCATCPMSQKGSKITEQGKEISACSQHRMLAVLPVDYPDVPPLRLKIAVTSDYDKDSPDLEAKGYRAFSQYRKFLKSNGVNYTGALVTKMRFDPTVAYPKVVFGADRWVTEAEADDINAAIEEGLIEQVLKGFTPEGRDGTDNVSKDSDDEEDIHNNEAETTSAGASDMADELDDWDEDEKPQKAEKKAPKKKAAKSKPKKAADDGPDNALDGEIVDDSGAVSDDAGADASSDISDLLDGWDD